MDDQNTGFDAAAAWMRMWSDCASTMMGTQPQFAPFGTPQEAARQTQSAALKAFSNYCEQFMRSPDFLQMLKQSLAGSIQFRKQLNDLLGQIRHEFQGTSRQDIDQLMLGMRHLEQRVVGGIERVAQRLGELHARLDAIENRQPSPGTGGQGEEGCCDHHEEHHHEGGGK